MSIERSPAPHSTTLLVIRGLTKRFTATLALDRVDFDVRRARFTRCSARTAPASRR